MTSVSLAMSLITMEKGKILLSWMIFLCNLPLLDLNKKFGRGQFFRTHIS